MAVVAAAVAAMIIICCRGDDGDCDVGAGIWRRCMKSCCGARRCRRTPPLTAKPKLSMKHDAAHRYTDTLRQRIDPRG
jgi:hypothetical protein